MNTGTRSALISWLRQFGVLLLIYLTSGAAMLWARQAPVARWLRMALTRFARFRLLFVPFCAER